MTEIPTWWLIVSALFFVVNIFVYAALVYVLLALKKTMEDTRPRIISLVEQGKQLATRVEQVAQRVEEVAESVKETVDGVGGRAKGVVGSAELVAQSASKQFERFSPFVVGAITAMRLIKSLNEIRKGKPAAQATKKGFLDRIPARKKKQGLLGRLLGD